jgi:hypothetical protein
LQLLSPVYALSGIVHFQVAHCRSLRYAEFTIQVPLCRVIMSSESPLPQPVKNVVVDTTSLPASSSASVWDRISKWVSENKALVYTIAGVAVVVTSAGVVYYLSDSGRTTPAPAPTEKKKSKNQRRKEKKKAEEEKKAKTATVQEGMLNPTAFCAPSKHSIELITV